ncbi:glycosyltransferase family 2 protein [Agrococcus sp. Marseille-P2731]|uniref:glycosyltransferase family 2 protein n=1 Tax=Agrococcus sp. Marseille-P2731 TaxID=1841862 RepID=UPI0009300297|nr:glycosyltransferase family 2 protein [Agrococcus sp. Marseille-P2731]
MTLVLTLMVRDEADILAAFLEHHLAQGVDRILVTDNGSVDGTREILAEYAAVAPVTVFDDLEHSKQQSRVVTAMARLAATEHGADWVINGDADEFLRPVDPGRTLAEVFDELPRSLGSFFVPVVNMVGPLARAGSGIRRLTYRDQRSEEQLRAAGLIAHPTPNAVHVGDPEVEVAQGNHRVSIEQRGEVPAELALEVLHLPWRSMAQVERKTRNMGEGYDASPDLHPSPKHHGMRDWRRMRAGLLTAFVACRLPTLEEAEHGPYERDERLPESLAALPALLPERLAAALDDADDQLFEPEAVLAERERAAIVAPFEALVLEELTNARLDADTLRQDRDRLGVQRDGTQGLADRLERELQEAHERERALESRIVDLERPHPLRPSVIAARAQRSLGRLLRR